MNEVGRNLNRKEQNRIEYIDIFRALGIILMVMGHVGFGKMFDHFIHAFHMPMFFFVSGFLYKPKKVTFWGFAKRKIISLLLPYFVFGSIHLFISSVLSHSISMEAIQALLFFPTNGKLPIAGALWFLMALFIADLLNHIISFIKSNSIQCIVVAVIALLGQFIPQASCITLPFAISPAMVGLGIMYIGRMIRYYEKIIICLKAYQIVFWSALITLSIFQSEYVNMRSAKYPSVFILFWVNAISASIILLNVSKKIKDLFDNQLIDKYLQSIGRNSIVYVCLNQIVILISSKALNKILSLFVLLPDMRIMNKGIILFVSLIILFLLSLLFEKTILNLLIGRKYTNEDIH